MFGGRKWNKVGSIGKVEEGTGLGFQGGGQGRTHQIDDFEGDKGPRHRDFGERGGRVRKQPC